MKNGHFLKKTFYLSLIFVPLSIALELFHAPSLYILFASSLSIIPLAWLMGRATEELSETMGAGAGGLLNASLGNAAELIIAITAMREGLFDVVKASITGSIIGNILLVLGCSFLLGGLKFKKQSFNKTAAGTGSTLLLLSAIGLLIPALFHYIATGVSKNAEQDLSLEISFILFGTYLLHLLFSLKTHKHIYNTNREDLEKVHKRRIKPLLSLIISTVLTVLMSEILVGSLRPAIKSMGMTEVFAGVILIAVIGNAAEHSTAVMAAIKNKMDITLSIAVGSSLQIALFVAPLLVFLGSFMKRPIDLIFTPMEVAAVTLSVLVVGSVSSDGQSNWMEGVMLISTYMMLAIAFYFMP